MTDPYKRTILQAMARHYSKRGHQPPVDVEAEEPAETIIEEGTLETGFLAEISQRKVASGLIVKARLPDPDSRDFMITVDGQHLHVSGMMPDGDEPVESVIKVPPGYKIGKTRAICCDGWLRIIVPKDS